MNPPPRMCNTSKYAILIPYQFKFINLSTLKDLLIEKQYLTGTKLIFFSTWPTQEKSAYMTHQFWQSGEVDALNTPKLLTLWDLLTCSILCKSSRRPGWKGRAQINYSHRWEYKYILFLTHAVLVLNGHS